MWQQACEIIFRELSKSFDRTGAAFTAYVSVCIIPCSLWYRSKMSLTDRSLDDRGRAGLPADFGGYACVRFSGDSVMTYPACCVASQWHTLCSQTRIEGLEIVRGFLAMLRNEFGEENVSMRSTQERKAKTCLFLPASALVVNDSTSNREAIGLVGTELVETRAAKRVARQPSKC